MKENTISEGVKFENLRRLYCQGRRSRTKRFILIGSDEPLNFENGSLMGKF